MSSKKQSDHAKDQGLENARVGYQVAASLRISRAEELWSQFNAFVTANSIILAASTLVFELASPSIVMSIGVPIIGLVLCLSWLILHARGVSYVRYYLLSAREIEEQFLSKQIKTISRGGDFAEGDRVKMLAGDKKITRRMSFVGRMLRVRSVAYLVILVFTIMHFLVLIQAIQSLFEI